MNINRSCRIIQIIEISTVLKEIVKKRVSFHLFFEKRRSSWISLWLVWNKNSYNRFNRPEILNLKLILMTKRLLKNNILK